MTVLSAGVYNPTYNTSKHFDFTPLISSSGYAAQSIPPACADQSTSHFPLHRGYYWTQPLLASEGNIYNAYVPNSAANFTFELQICGV